MTKDPDKPDDIPDDEGDEGEDEVGTDDGQPYDQDDGSG